MNEEKRERLFLALGGVGGDLIEMAEKRAFAPGRWRKWGALAACLAVLLCLSALALPYFPMGCGSSESSGMTEAVQDAGPEAEEAPAAEEPAEAPQAQVVFRNTVYHVEARYSGAEAETVLGDYLGTVEDGDEAEWIGCKVYRCQAEAEAPDDAILVETGDGYLYCVP